MTFISYAQNFEDVLLWRAFRDVRDGFYIDIGAAHPDIDSVTRAFYDHGWHGINVEPVPEFHTRLLGARPRDTNLRVAIGTSSGQGTVYVVAGTGLSTVDPALADQHRDASLDVRAEDVPVATLAEICRAHAPATVHFLKIDVEGAEQAVLDSADFAEFRPWIVLVEATAPGTTVQTHAAWEPTLLAARYRFLWFDGLNRFYAADEHFDSMAVHFQVPVCVFDDFLRAADTEWTRRISHAEIKVGYAEMQAAELLERSMVAEYAAAAADGRARDAERQAREFEQRAHDLDQRADLANGRARDAERQARESEQRAHASEQRALVSDNRADVADQRLLQTEQRTAGEMHHLKSVLQRSQAEEAALRASTSWKLTAPLRGAVHTARGLAGRKRAPGAPLPAATPAPSMALATASGAPPIPMARHAGRSGHLARPTGIVHQFHSGSAVNDAITNALLLLRTQLRLMGYRSDVFVEHRDPLLQGELRLASELPSHGDYVLILHHSMGFDAYNRIVALPATKILMYHNITPPELFAGQPDIQRYAALGRAQLADMRGRVVSALADSEYNAIELRALGFPDVAACTLLFDLDALRVAPPSRVADTTKPFTILFVGRIVPSKGQLDLLEAFAAWRSRDDARPSRLVLVGRWDGAGQTYMEAIRARIGQLGLDSSVVLTGLIDDDALRAHFAEADLYVSLSHHEGFGVPLVEASARGIPVLAWPAGAVGYTLDVAAGLLHTRDPDGVAQRIAELADDADRRAALAAAQSAALAGFALPTQLARLSVSLARAGAAAPRDARVEALLMEKLRFTVAGHVNKTYSLAAINRTLARVLEASRPGSVRLVPVEGEPTDDLAEVPSSERAGIAALAARPPHDTGPVVVISQHYPIHVPSEAGDVSLAYVFWEESLLPDETVQVLNRSFAGVLAPSRFVAKALVDSGVSVPVHVVGLAPELDAYRALPGAPQTRPGPFTFLHVSSAFPRKGVDALLAAYAQAFRAGDPVRLVIKTFPNPHNDVAQQIEALRRADTQAPAIELVDRDLDEGALSALYRDADAMVLPTRGEGFNLPAAEAMAAGLPLIVTGFGGHRDFCDDGTARLVAYVLARSDSHVATSTSLWAEPDPDDLAAALREAVADRPAALARAARARTAIDLDLAPSHFTNAIVRAAIRSLMRVPADTLRVCVISSFAVRCGIAGYTGFLLDAMRAADPGLLVTVLSDMRAPETDGPDGMDVRPSWTLGAADNDVTIGAAVSQLDPDMLMIQHQPGLLDWATLGRVLTSVSVPHRTVAVTLHNTANLREVEAAARDTAVIGLRLATRVIVHTLVDVERLGRLGIEGNVVLVPHGAPVPHAPSPERDLDASQGVTLGCCGFLLPGKGIPMLVEAAGLLRARWPRLRLRLLNAHYGHPVSDAEAELVRSAIQEAGLGDAVELVSDYLPFDDATRRLTACDVVVLPYSRSGEGASGALQMALASGRCVAVTPIDLFGEAGEAVFRLPGTDAASIAAGVSTLLADRTLRMKTTDDARAWMDARSWSRIGRRTAGMLRGCFVATSVPTVE